MLDPVLSADHHVRAYIVCDNAPLWAGAAGSGILPGVCEHLELDNLHHQAFGFREGIRDNGLLLKFNLRVHAFHSGGGELADIRDLQGTAADVRVGTDSGNPDNRGGHEAMQVERRSKLVSWTTRTQ